MKGSRLPLCNISVEMEELTISQPQQTNLLIPQNRQLGLVEMKRTLEHFTGFFPINFVDVNDTWE